jgi:hypothetical protein
MHTMDYWRTPEPLEVVGLYIYVTTAMIAAATLVDLVVTLYQMLTPGSESSAFPVPLVGTAGAATAYAKITVPAIVTPGYISGKVLRRLFNPITWLPGVEYKLYVTTALAASPSGAYQAGLLVDFHPESGANCTQLTELTS